MIEEMIERILIQRNKAVDDMILGEIRKIATENGIDTIITLNDKAIIQALKNFAEVTKWIDVNERLPDKEGDYLCVMSNNNINPFVIIKPFVNGMFYVTEWYKENVGRKVTHWMPLPEPPSCGAKMDGGDTK